ncbi:hypothetical protein [Sphingomonas aliaeris]|uniref:hypothetical protein n=1 Tax=Sphingomonas aliaeris TaxID=2759526 RepID=UPI001CEC8F7F|nr:hypothetical protein [Sphingomonas aliaeris]
MKPLRHATDIMGLPIGSNTQRAPAGRATPTTRRRQSQGRYRQALDGGNVLGPFRDGRGSFIAETLE